MPNFTSLATLPHVIPKKGEGKYWFPAVAMLLCHSLHKNVRSKSFTISHDL